MIRRIILSLAVLAVLAATGFAPVLATKAILIHNNREESVKIKLDGDEKYTFTVEPGWTERLVEAGKYEYVYDDCAGDDVSGEIEVTENYDTTIEIEECDAKPVDTKFVVYSNFSDSIKITLTAQSDSVFSEDYALTAELGKNKYTPVQSGWYTFSYDACGTTFSGEIRITKNGKATLTLKGCEQLVYQDFAKPNPVKMRVANNFSVGVDITLIGPLTYYVNVVPGVNRINVVSGTYTYIYAAHGVRYEGSVVVSQNGNSIIWLPKFTSSELD